ncbi:MAG: ABC transporter ATP-binding protein [Betaproteobacteria bacterium]
MNQSSPELALRGVCAWYGQSQSLHGVDLNVRAGEVVALIGRNGAGKTTTLKSVMGLVPRRSGAIEFKRRSLLSLNPESIARLGITYCPEERGIYSSLTVFENLKLPPVVAQGGFTLDELFELFPNLLERRNNQGSKLSGGEQQMLAIARILRTGAKLLLLDEPTEGLAPVIVERIGQIIQLLRQRGYTILLVEQNFRFVSRLVDRSYVMEHGRIVDEFDQNGLLTHADRVKAYLGI